MHRDSGNLSVMDTAFYRTVRFLFWPVVVIASLNIEAWAEKNGYAELLGSRLPESGILSHIYSALTTPVVSYGATFLAGAIVLAYLGHWAERIEDKHPAGPPMWVHTTRLNSLLLMIELKQQVRWGVPIQYRIEEVNKTLAFFELTPLPTETELLLDDANESAAYLKAIYTLLRTRQIDAAKRFSAGFRDALSSKSHG